MTEIPAAAPAAFYAAYIQTALWSSVDANDEPLDANYSALNITPSAYAEMRRDCDRFYTANYEALRCDGVTFGPDFGQDGRAGHDFWLTRNHHGAGFWDGDWPEPQATLLTNAAHAFGECDLYVNDDGQIDIV